ncbi:centromere/kinetochore protein [Achlya hypogyna]|uniref:Centromere/kinetochore protein n=1 Tax=Achlya hypogyna TaxID=1202772 RepID=A0A1V9YPS7_ACHHY|nr:centromere/kinetochore protein [Achlya hypogyna]
MSVTTEDLTRKLSGLHEEVASVKAQIFEAIRTFYSTSGGVGSSMSLDEAMQFAASWSRKVNMDTPLGDLPPSEIQTRMTHLEAILNDTVGQLQRANDDESTEGLLHQSLVMHERLSVQIQQSQGTLSLLQLLSDLDTALQSFDVALETTNITRAADDLGAIATGLAKIDTQHPKASMEYRIVEIMRVEHQARATALRSFLAEAVAAEWNVGSRVINVTPSALPVWVALERTRAKHAHLEQLAGALFQHIFSPLVDDPTLVPSVRQGILTLAPKTSGSVPEGITRIQVLCAHVTVIIKFLASALPGEALLSELMAIVWTTALEAAFTARLQATLPADAAQLRDFKTHLTPVMHSFEASLVGLRLSLPPSLAAFGQHLDVQFAEHKRATLLQEARHRMQHDYLSSVLVPSHPAVLLPTTHKKGAVSTLPPAADELDRTAPLRVSVCAQWLLAQATQLLSETTACDPSVAASMLFHTARDLFCLFRALMPTLYKEELRFDPRLVLLVHNDAMYFSRHMLTLCNKQQLPAPLNETATMVDLVPDMREMGEATLLAFAKDQAGQLEQSLRTASVAYHTLDDDGHYNQMETAVKSCLFKLERIVQAWKGGLTPADVYARVLGNMLEPVLRLQLAALLQPPRVVALPPKAVHQTHYLFSLWLACENHFPSPALVDKYVPSAKTFRSVTLLLEENNVATVVDQWNDGVLTALTRPQVTALIQCLAPDAKESVHALAP